MTASDLCTEAEYLKIREHITNRETPVLYAGRRTIITILRGGSRYERTYQRHGDAYHAQNL